MTPSPIVFPVDVDNTLLDNDRIQNDLRRHLEREFGAACREEKELDDIERRYPAEHYVLVDDKPPILTAVKKIWGDRVTTAFPRQGRYARDANVVAACTPADVTVERIGDLLDYDLSAFLAGSQQLNQ